MASKPSIAGSYGARSVLAWHRRAGKDITCINWCAYASMQRVGLYWLVFPFLNQGRRIAWTGIDGGGKAFIAAWPDELIERKSDAEMRIHLKNGSIIQIMGADDPNKAVGSNPIGMVFSEYSLCNPAIWKLTNPILAENGGWAVFNGTPRGENHFYDILLEAKRNKDWFGSHLTARDTKAVTPKMLENARTELKDEAIFQQEFMTSFTSPIQGAFYGNQMRWLAKNNRFSDDLSVDPKLEVHTAWDLGVDDSTAIWFYQQYGTEIRIVDFYENSGEGLTHYVRYCKQWSVDNNATYGKHYGPFDLAVRELSSGDSRLEIARRMGLRFTVVKKHLVEDGIENTRQFLPRCWFNSKKCHSGINALKCYTKDYDPVRNIFKPKPLHNWASHASDAFRYLAWGFRDEKKRSEYADQRSYETEYSIFD